MSFLQVIKTEPDIDNDNETLSIFNIVKHDVKIERDDIEEYDIHNTNDRLKIELCDVKNELIANNTALNTQKCHENWTNVQELNHTFLYSENKEYKTVDCVKVERDNIHEYDIHKIDDRFEFELHDVKNILITNSTGADVPECHAGVQELNTDSSNLECKECGKVFKTRNYFTRHLHSHKDPHKLKCRKCGKIFQSQFELLDHANSHTCTRKYACEKCGKEFSSRSYLLIHLRIHGDLFEYECKCGKAFKVKAALIQHMQMHSDLCNFECNMCGKTFKTRNILIRHMNAHSSLRDFKCLKCERAFKTKSNMLKHMNIHADICKFECADCGKTFKTKLYLSKHLKRHSDCFKCSICAKTFKSKYAISRHIINIHKDPSKDMSNNNNRKSKK